MDGDMPVPMREQTLTVRHQHMLRGRIAKSADILIDRLKSCVRGDVQLTATQVRAASTLLNKVLPDLQSVSMQHDGAGGVSITIQQFGQPAPEAPAPAAERVTLDPPTTQAIEADSVQPEPPQMAASDALMATLDPDS